MKHHINFNFFIILFSFFPPHINSSHTSFSVNFCIPHPITSHPSLPSFFAPYLLLFGPHFHPVYCVTSPAKDERYRAPPPTPPGYQGLALGDLGLTDGVVGGPGGLFPRPPHLKPPDYSVALQRSKLLQSPAAANSLAEAWRLLGNHPLHHQEARTADSRQGHSRPPSICVPPPELAESEDGTSPNFIVSPLHSISKSLTTV